MDEPASRHRYEWLEERFGSLYRTTGKGMRKRRLMRRYSKLRMKVLWLGSALILQVSCGSRSRRLRQSGKGTASTQRPHGPAHRNDSYAEPYTLTEPDHTQDTYAVSLSGG